MTAPRYLDLSGVADYLSVSRSTVHKLVKDKRIPAPIALTPRLHRWDRESIDKALAIGNAAGVHSADAITRDIVDDILSQSSRRQRRSEEAA